MNFDFNPKVLTFSGPQEISGKGGISLTILGLKETSVALHNLTKFVNLNAAKAIAGCVIHLLSNTQPKVPIDTGQLRESGRATINLGFHETTVGRGRADGTAESFLSSIKKSIVSRATEIQGDVSYFRLNEEGLDIALWTHEDLNPYGSGKHPRARTPGTGPKYLESTWLQYENYYIDFIRDILSGKTFESELLRISKIKQKRVGTYTLNYVDLVFLENI